jgi:hypothetical protein
MSAVNLIKPAIFEDRLEGGGSMLKVDTSEGAMMGKDNPAQGRVRIPALLYISNPGPDSLGTCIKLCW